MGSQASGRCSTGMERLYWIVIGRKVAKIDGFRERDGKGGTKSERLKD